MQKHIQEENDQWLKNQCNRYVNGQCTTLACLKRGGEGKTLPINMNNATCQAHEILLELQTLRYVAPTCPICNNVIDPEVCHCGEYIKNHNPYYDGHNPVPMGCTCGYVTEAEQNHIINNLSQRG